MANTKALKDGPIMGGSFPYQDFVWENDLPLASSFLSSLMAPTSQPGLDSDDPDNAPTPPVEPNERFDYNNPPAFVPGG